MTGPAFDVGDSRGEARAPVGEVLLRGGTVIDGTHAPAFRADVLLSGGRVAQVGTNLRASTDAEVVDAGDLVVAPGFIDAHSHADFTLPTFPAATNSILQGVTTEVLGNCGLSAAPRSGDPERAGVLERHVVAEAPGLAWRWHTFAEYIAALDAARPRVNCALLVGHSTIRMAVLGGEARPPAATERAAMVEEARAALAAGAIGLSSGLSYAPGAWASTDEIAELAGVVGRHGGIYASHIRNQADALVAAVDEALDIGRRAGVAVEVSHLSSIGDRPGNLRAALDRIDGAVDDGRHAGFDVYPYTAGSTSLGQLLPPWAHEGGNEAMLARLRRDEDRTRIREDIERGIPGWMNFARGAWHRITLARIDAPEWRAHHAKPLDVVAAALGADPVDVVADALLGSNGAAMMLTDLLEPDDVASAIAHPLGVIGADGVAVAPDYGSGHPRAFGTFARILGVHVRERGDLTLEAAVRRMTAVPADRFGLGHRGRVQPGAIADIVVFDAATVRDRATYDEPDRVAEGIAHVLIGGRIAVRQGVPTRERHGRVLRSTPSERSGAGGTSLAAAGSGR